MLHTFTQMLQSLPHVKTVHVKFLFICGPVQCKSNLNLYYIYIKYSDAADHLSI